MTAVPGVISIRRIGRASALGVLCALALSGCKAFPDDMEGTTNKVTATRSLHAGIVAAGPVEPDERALARRIAKAGGADTRLETGSAEVLLRRLEEGDLDLVVGEFAGASPWRERVAFTRAANSGPEPDKHTPVLRAAVQKGENRWLMFVNKAIGGAQP